MQRLVVVFRLIVLCGLLMACRTPLAHGTEIYIPPLSAASGSTVQVPVMIDEVGNLAGIKLVMRYDPALLTFKRGAKTSHTDSLMHIINSKNPGVLILVMAGARGIKGAHFPLVTLTFAVSAGLKEKRSTHISITENQLMSDTLRAIQGTVKVHPLELTP